MTIWRIAFATFLAALLFCVSPPETNSLLKRSGRDLDVAIAGKGYFAFCEPGTEVYRYSRHGHFTIDASGYLGSTFGGKPFHLDPPINVPNDHTRIAINSDGTVQIQEAGDWLTIAQLQLVRFSKEPAFDNPLALQIANDDVGPPMPNYPLSAGLGSLQQGWIETRPNLTLQVACRIGIAILADYPCVSQKTRFQFRKTRERITIAFNGTDGRVGFKVRRMALAR